jgi:hypothetical protein
MRRCALCFFLFLFFIFILLTLKAHMKYKILNYILPVIVSLSISSCMDPAELEKAINEVNYNPSSYSPGKNYAQTHRVAYNKGYEMGRSDAKRDLSNNYRRYNFKFTGETANPFKRGYEVAYRNYMPHYTSSYQRDNYSQAYSHQDYRARETQGTGNYRAEVVQGGVRITQNGQQVSFLRTASPNVERQHFINNKKQIVVKSRGNHGPATVELFDAKTGVLKDKVLAYAIRHGQPAWARGMQD